MMEAASVTGPAKNLLGFCRWLRTPEGAETGISVTIATFSRNPDISAQGGFLQGAREIGIETHIIRERHRFDLAVAKQLRQIVDSVDPAIIQTHNNKSHLWAKALPGIRAQRLWCAFHHGDAYPNLRQRIYNRADRLSLRSADRVVTVCQAFAPRLMACGVADQKIRILHNAVTLPEPLPAGKRRDLRGDLGVGESESVVLSTGRLSREKGHSDLLHAMARLRQISRGWKIVIVGEGPERATLERLARSLGISERVVFAGFRADAVRLLSIADVFVLPSHSEGSSNVLLEAMGAGIPIVATSVGGTPEIILDGQSGLLVPDANPAALANAIVRVLDDTDLASRLATAGCLRATEEFSLATYRRRLCDVYAEALRGANQTPG